MPVQAAATKHSSFISWAVDGSGY